MCYLIKGFINKTNYIFRSLFQIISSFSFVLELVNLALGYAQTFGNVIRVWLGSKLIVFLVDADDIEIILNSHVHIDKATEYRFFKPWLGEGLLISSGM